MKACACPGFSLLRIKARVAVAKVIVTSIRKMWKVDTYIKTNQGNKMARIRHKPYCCLVPRLSPCTNEKAWKAGWGLEMRQYCLIVLQATLSAERRSGHTVTNELFESLLLRLSGQRGEPKNEALISPKNVII